VGWTLGQLADRVGGTVAGDERREVSGIRSLESAESEHLSFVAGAKHLAAARRSRAGALLVARGAGDLAADRIAVDDVMAALAELLALLHPRARPESGIHPTAVLGEGCVIEPSASVGPYVVLGRSVHVAAGAALGPHAVVGERCEIGEGSVLHAHVVLYDGVRVGPRSVIHAGTILGADGFGYLATAEGHRKIPQVGGVEIGSDVEIGALSAVDRATLDRTVVGSGTKIDNLVQVAHNVRIGRNVVVCGQAGVGGSASLEDGVVLAGQVGVIDHAVVGAGARVAAKSAVLSSLAPGAVAAGIPALPIGQWRRQQSLLRRLAAIWRRLRALERRLGAGDREEGDE